MTPGREPRHQSRVASPAGARRRRKRGKPDHPFSSEFSEIGHANGLPWAGDVAPRVEKVTRLEARNRNENNASRSPRRDRRKSAHLCSIANMPLLERLRLATPHQECTPHQDDRSQPTSSLELRNWTRPPDKISDDQHSGLGPSNRGRSVPGLSHSAHRFFFSFKSKHLRTLRGADAAPIT
jgi:hypothetical protein